MFSQVYVVCVVAGAGVTRIEDMKKHAFFATINWDKLFKREVTPPFKPVVGRVDEAFYFDTEFTSRTPKGGLWCVRQAQAEWG